MVLVYEYRIPLPFTMEEYEIAQLYMVARFSASESSGDSGDGVEILKNEPFEEKDRKGQYTHKIYHLASKLPSWMVSLLPKNALILEEEAWNAYPHCTTVLKCPFLSKFKLILETNHVADRGDSENALNMDPKTLKKRQVEFIDIAMDQVENYVAEEDPTLFKSEKTGRGPLKEGWIAKCEPVMCAYKCVTVDVPYWGFGSRIEKFIAKTAQRKILLEGHRKCFTWLDEWHGLTMQDVRRMEAETAEAIKQARAMALNKLNCGGLGGSKGNADTADNMKEEEEDTYGSLHTQNGDANSPRTGASNRSTFSRNPSHRQSSLRQRSPSISVGPSFSMGISTISATEKESSESHPERVSTSSVPPRPISSPTQWKSANGGANGTFKTPASTTAHLSEDMVNLLRAGSCESFEARTQLDSQTWELEQYGLVQSPTQDEESHASVEVAKCVDVLDRAISWAKALKVKKDGIMNGSAARKSGVVAPVDEISDSNGALAKPKANDVDRYLNVLDTALSAVTKRPSNFQGLKQSPS
ncbi:unnamed protein product [Calypogeia fissa]